MKYIQRVKLWELIAHATAMRRRRVTIVELAEHMFDNERDVSRHAKYKRLWNWNEGRDLGTMTPRSILRMAKYCGVYDVREIMELQRRTNNEEGA